MFGFLRSSAAVDAVGQAYSLDNVGRDVCHGYLKCRDSQPDEHDCTEYQQALLRIRLQSGTSLSV